ncbi:MAG: glycosyltransferase family 4 protein [Clostridia bacterium]|nr:glycosyltransferase family 4 protein [Clostridia bacterium]
MRIVVIDTAASKTGALSVLNDFYEYVKTYETMHDWIFLLSKPYLEETEHIKVIEISQVKKNWFERIRFDLITGAGFVANLKPDVVFSLQNTLLRGYHGKQVVYIHQPLGFQTEKNFSFLKRNEREYAIYQHLIGKLINASAKRADKVIVQTKWMQQAVIKKTHAKAENVVNIMPDVESMGQPDPNTEHLSNLFFFPSGVMIYKNHECVLKACDILNQRGITDFKIVFTISDLREVTDYRYAREDQTVKCLGQIDKEEVIAYYQKSVLLFPSYIETFGYPLAEARQFESLIVASDEPFCHEVLEGYQNAYYFNPFSPKELADLMENIITGKIKRAEVVLKDQIVTEKLTQKTEQTTKKSSWAKVVEVIVNC